MSKTKLTDPFIRNHPKPKKRIEICDTMESGLAIRISTTGYKSFVYRYRFGKTVKRYTIGRFPAVRLSIARDKAKELSWKVSNGIDPLEEKKKKRYPPEKFTFDQLANLFIERHLPQLRKRTRDEYKRIIDLELNPTFSQLPVDEISRKKIIDLLDTIALDRNTPVFSNRVRAVLSSMFSFGIDKAILEVNPVLNVKRKRKRKNGEPVERRRKRTYSPEEIRNLWNAFLIQSEPVRTIFMMLLISGQRIGETRRMKWAHINWVEKTWTIPEEETKAKREHVVPLSDFAIQVLQDISAFSNHSEYAFPSRVDNTKPIRWLQKAVERVQEISNIYDFRCHDLRRSMATFMGEMGMRQIVIGKVLNHKELGGDNNVTGIYNRHTYNKQKRLALQQWSEYLIKILEGKEVDEIIEN